MISSKWLCVISVLLSTTGCSMLTSRDVENNAGWPITAGGLQYSLPTARIKVKLSQKGNDIIQIRMEQPVYEADPQHTYLLRYETSPFASDKFDIDVDPKTGLLMKIDMTADDKLDEIIVEIAKAIALEAAEEDGETVLAERIIDPTTELDQLEKEFNDIVIKKTRKDPKIDFFIKPSIKKPAANQASSTQSNKTDCSVGVCYRQVMPYVIGFSFENNIAYETTVNLPNNAPIISLGLDRSLFVTRINTIEFEDGIPKKVHLEKPSEGLRLAELPLEIARGVFSVPAELLQLKINKSDKETALANAKVSEIDAKKALIEKQMKANESSNAGTSQSLLVGTNVGRIKNAKFGAGRDQRNTPENGGALNGPHVDSGSNGTLP